MTCLTFPEGTTVYAGPTTLAGDGMTISGEGSHRSRIILPAGFDITYSDLKAPPRVEGVTLINANTGGTALKITGPVAATSTKQGPLLGDVHVEGDDYTADYWAKGIHLVDVWNPILRGINVKGKDQAQPPFLMATGIEYERTQVFDAEKIDIYHAQDAIKQSGATYGEGASIRDFNLIGVNRGIVMLQGGGYVIGDGHINSYQTGIDLSGKAQLCIDKVLFYKTHLSLANYIGLNINIAQQLKVTNCTVDGGWETAHLCAGTTYGMVLSVVFKSLFGGNLFTNFKTPSAGIVVGYQSRDNTFLANRSDGAGTVVQVNPDAGPNNFQSANKP